MEYKIGDKVKIKNIKCPVLKERYPEGEECVITEIVGDGSKVATAKFNDGRNWHVNRINCDIEPITTKHKHAEGMLEYAKDAMTTDKPWELWEGKYPIEMEWHRLYSNPSWFDDVEYRRKPKIIHINGFEVPEPCREKLETNQKYWVVSIFNNYGIVEFIWWNSKEDMNTLKRGFVHLTKEAAELHAKALFSFTKIKE